MELIHGWQKIFSTCNKLLQKGSPEKGTNEINGRNLIISHRKIEYVTIVRESIKKNWKIFSTFLLPYYQAKLFPSQLTWGNSCSFAKKIISLWLLQRYRSLYLALKCISTRADAVPWNIIFVPCLEIAGNEFESRTFYNSYLWSSTVSEPASLLGWNNQVIEVSIVFVVVCAWKTIKNILSFCYDWMTFIISCLARVKDYYRSQHYVPFWSSSES